MIVPSNIKKNKLNCLQLCFNNTPKIAYMECGAGQKSWSSSSQYTTTSSAQNLHKKTNQQRTHWNTFMTLKHKFQSAAEWLWQTNSKFSTPTRSSYLRIYFGIPATISDSIPQWSDPRRILKNPKDQKYIDF